jgi:hypothetical protein
MYHLLPCLKRFLHPSNLVVVCSGLVGFVLTLEACLGGSDLVLEPAGLEAAAVDTLVMSFPDVLTVHCEARAGEE